jgi:hypothetical protein
VLSRRRAREILLRFSLSATAAITAWWLSDDGNLQRDGIAEDSKPEDFNCKRGCRLRLLLGTSSDSKSTNESRGMTSSSGSSASDGKQITTR